MGDVLRTNIRAGATPRPVWSPDCVITGTDTASGRVYVGDIRMPNAADTPPQITEAVTQRNVKVVGEAPAQAIATIYMALAHAIAIVFENAVVAQRQEQQQRLSALAAGVATHSTAAGEVGPPPETNMSQASEEPRPTTAPINSATDASSEPAPNSAAPPDASQAHTPTLVEQLRAAIEAERDRHTVYSGINQQIEQAVKLSNEQVLGSAGEVAYAVRASTDAFVAGLRQVCDGQHRQRMQSIQVAGTAMCVEAMLKSPEHAGDYAELLQIIKHLV
jgi:hypothetical protein